MASGWIQRAYKYHMEYRAGKDQVNVDALSRLPMGEVPLEVSILGDTVLMLQMLSDSNSIVTASAIRKWIIPVVVYGKTHGAAVMGDRTGPRV